MNALSRWANSEHHRARPSSAGASSSREINRIRPLRHPLSDRASRAKIRPRIPASPATIPPCRAPRPVATWPPCGRSLTALSAAFRTAWSNKSPRILSRNPATGHPPRQKTPRSLPPPPGTPSPHRFVHAEAFDLLLDPQLPQHRHHGRQKRFAHDQRRPLVRVKYPHLITLIRQQGRQRHPAGPPPMIATD